MGSCKHCGQTIKPYRYYGENIETLALKLKVPEWKIRYLANTNRLQECLDAGKVTRKVSRSLYRDKYGLGIVEISDKLDIDIHVVHRLHHSGRLAERLTD